ncbi:hypothetical protein I7I52_03533 [Histoplasma capsulatum]|uniref:Transmembrane protein n=1 Tax=Ajellomyces capsulatus TaxID=5037 RepID=A0A8H7Z9I2_AJECA|nr:hypothetical protein I7I52_03533 [Histoplasma capsulatum]
MNLSGRFIHSVIYPRHHRAVSAFLFFLSFLCAVFPAASFLLFDFVFSNNEKKKERERER